MCAVRAGPEIVNTGLVLHLDAANPRSYPGSGTVWNDLSSNSNNGTLIGDATFNTANNGGIAFLANGYYNSGYIMPASNFTVNIVFQCTVFSPWAVLWASEVWNAGTGYLAFFSNSNAMVFTRGGSTSMAVTIPNIAAINYITCTLSSDNQAIVYLNGNLLGVGTIPVTSVSKSLIVNSRYSNNGIGFTDSKSSVVSHFSVYNRVLSAQEISQNFEATRSRYGI